MGKNPFEKASVYVFLITVVLSIISFTSSTFMSLPAVKTLIIGVGLLASVILYIIYRFQEKSVEFPSHPLVYIGGALGLSVVISCAVSSSFWSSFMGKSFGAGAGIFLLTLLVTALFTAVFVRSLDKVLLTYATIAGAFSLVALFHVVRLIGGAGILQFGAFTSMTSTMVGSWYDLSLLTGVVLLLSLVTLEFLNISKKQRWAAIVIFVVAAFFLIITGTPFIWGALALVSLGLAIYKYVAVHFSKIPWFLGIVFLVTALFVWKGPAIVNYSEVGLTWQYTIDVVAPTIKTAPIFGVGPDRFANQYLLNKPAVINQSQFWSVAFPTGQSVVLTSLVTQGLAGFILWLAFIITFVWLGIRSMRALPTEEYARYISLTSFFSALFLWISMIFYTPSHVVLFITFIMTGIWVGQQTQVQARIKQFSTKKTSVAICAVVIAIIALWGIVLFAKETFADIYFQKALKASTADVSAAKPLLQSAVWWHETDTYDQALTQVDIYGVNQLMSRAAAASTSTTATASISQETSMAVGALITEALGYIHSAEAIDPANPSNYLVEASVYETVAGLRIPNGYENAKTSYGKALQLDPLNPATYLSLAKLDYFVGSTTLAVSDLNAALQLKPDYADALMEAGVISYSSKDYQTAQAAFTKVLQIDGTNANAAYYLSLTLVRLGDTKDAITELMALSQAYPDNQQIATTLKTLKAGRSPF